MKSNPKTKLMCVNVEKLDIQNDENEFHDPHHCPPATKIPSTIDPNADK